MAETIPPTVPETVAPTDSLLGNVDFSSLVKEPEPDAAAPEADAPAEGAEQPDGAAAPEAEDADAEGEAEDAPADDETPADEPEPEAAKPAPTKPAEPKEDVAAREAEQHRQQRTARLAEINRDIKAIRATPKDQYDPFDHGAKLTDLLAEKDELRDEELTELRRTQENAAAIAQVEVQWQKFERENPDIGAKGRAIWDDEIAKARKAYPHSDDAAAAVAQERWKDRIKLVRSKAREGKGKPAAAAPTPATGTAKPAAKAPAAPAGKPVPTKGGSNLIPKGAAGRPVIQETDPLKQFVNDAAGGIRNFLA